MKFGRRIRTGEEEEEEEEETRHCVPLCGACGVDSVTEKIQNNF